MTGQPNPSTHEQHDLLLVASLADRELTGDEAAAARAQVDACRECSTLHTDLLAISRATTQLPPIPRPRDFQLRPVDAQRLRPNLVRRIFGSFGTARDGFSRPLAMGFTTLGLAGLLLGVIPGTLSLGGSTGTSIEAPSREMQQSPMSASGAPGDAAASAGPAIQGGETANGPAVGPVPDRMNGQGNTENFGLDGDTSLLARLSDDSSGVSQLVVISGTLLIIGLGLFLLRWTSRRFGG